MSQVPKLDSRSSKADVVTNGVGTNLVFIVGVGRSGTSLLQSMLNAHADISFVPETQFFRKYVANGTLNKIFGHGGQNAVAAKLKADEKLGRFGITDDELSEIIESCSEFEFSRNLYLAVLGYHARRHRSPIWIGDKDPRCIEHLPAIFRHFSDCRIIHIVRDPRDVLASKKVAAWSKNRSPQSLIFANRIQLKLGRLQGRRFFDQHYFEVRYETLIEDAQATLKHLCEFLNLEYDRGMLNFAKSSRELVSPQEMQWKKETLGPLLTGNCGKWRTNLTAPEVALCEQACHEALEDFDYSRSNSFAELSFKERMWVTGWSKVIAAFDPIYRWYRSRQLGQ